MYTVLCLTCIDNILLDMEFVLCMSDICYIIMCIYLQHTVSCLTCNDNILLDVEFVLCMRVICYKNMCIYMHTVLCLTCIDNIFLDMEFVLCMSDICYITMCIYLQHVYWFVFNLHRQHPSRYGICLMHEWHMLHNYVHISLTCILFCVWPALTTSFWIWSLSYAWATYAT